MNNKTDLKSFQRIVESNLELFNNPNKNERKVTDWKAAAKDLRNALDDLELAAFSISKEDDQYLVKLIDYDIENISERLKRIKKKVNK